VRSEKPRDWLGYPFGSISCMRRNTPERDFFFEVFEIVSERDFYAF